MGFTERVKQNEADDERARVDLETRYSRWQHAVFTLNQTISRYIFANSDLRSRLTLRDEIRHITDSFLKRQKQLDRLIIVQTATNRAVSLEALPLWPAILGASGRVDLVAPHIMQEYYVTWDGSGKLPNNWTLKSSDGKFHEALNEKSFDELLDRLFPAT